MKRCRKILLGIVAVLGAAALISVLHHYQLKSAVTRYRAELKAKGNLPELSQILPTPVPLEQNGASNFLKAVSLWSTNKIFDTNPPSAMRMVAPGKAMICAVQPEIRDFYFHATNSWEQEQAAMDQNKESLALLRETMNRPKLDFHLAYEKGFADGSFFTNMHLVEIKQAARLLTSEAMIHLHQGNASGAIKNTQSALALSSAMQDQRLIISELVRNAIASIAQAASWEILQSDHATDADLAALQKDWEGLDFIRSYRDALIMEHAWGDVTLLQMRNSDVELRKYIGMMGTCEPTFFEQTKLSAKIFLWRNWWSYPDELRSLQGDEVLVETANSAMTNTLFAAAFKQQNIRLDALGVTNLPSLFETMFSDNADFHSMLSSGLVTLGPCFKKVMRGEASKRMTITAIALKRFQLEHGAYPAQLTELAPKFLASVPLDPVNGKPLSYRRNSDGTFLLYSIGEDEADDGGNPNRTDDSTSLNWLGGRDWVWPQPATPQEIRAWEKQEAKKRK